MKCAYSGSARPKWPTFSGWYTRLRHRAHDDRLDQVRFFAADDLAAARRSDPAASDRDRSAAGCRSRAGTAAAFEPFVLGPAVHAVQRRHAMLLEEARRLDVRGDHAFLDQPVRIVARAIRRTRRSCRAASNRTFSSGASKSSAPRWLRAPSSALKTACSCISCGPTATTSGSCPRGRIGEIRGDLRVRQPRRRAHHAFEEPRARHLALRADAHLADHAQPVDLRIQRAQAVRQRLGQHRQDAVRKVDRRAAILRFLVERANPGSTYVATSAIATMQPPAAAHFFAVHRVVEVARVFAVDRHQRQLAQDLRVRASRPPTRCGRTLRPRRLPRAGTRTADRANGSRSRFPCRARRARRARASRGPAPAPCASAARPA